MNVYQVTGMSKCGTYFQEYLQRVILFAEDEKQALEMAKETYAGEWVVDKLEVELIQEGIPTEPTCIYSIYDTDY